MFRYFKKLFSILLVAVVIVTSITPPDTVSAAGPAKPVFKVVKRAKKSVTLKINKTKNATGYQIFIANSKHGKYKQTAASRIRTVKITKLKKNKVYYVKIRAFKTVGYHITYGKFSKIIKIEKYGKKKPVPSIVPDVPTGSAIGEIQDPEDTVQPTSEPAQMPEQTPAPEPTQIPDVDFSTEPPKDVLA